MPSIVCALRHWNGVRNNKIYFFFTLVFILVMDNGIDFITCSLKWLFATSCSKTKKKNFTQLVCFTLNLLMCHFTANEAQHSTYTDMCNQREIGPINGIDLLQTIRCVYVCLCLWRMMKKIGNHKLNCITLYIKKTDCQWIAILSIQCKIKVWKKNSNKLRRKHHFRANICLHHHHIFYLIS